MQANESKAGSNTQHRAIVHRVKDGWCISTRALAYAPWCGSALECAIERDVMLTQEKKRVIATEATAAARTGKSIVDALPYPYGSEEAMHWIAIWMLEYGK